MPAFAALWSPHARVFATKSPIDLAGKRTSPTKRDRVTVSAVFRLAAAVTSNGFGTSALFEVKPAIAASTAFSFAAIPLAVPPADTCTVNGSATAAGRRIFEATASVTCTHVGVWLVRLSLSSATANFDPSSYAYVRILRAAGFASNRKATATGMKNSAASGTVAWSRSYAVTLFATSSNPSRATFSDGEIVRRELRWET